MQKFSHELRRQRAVLASDRFDKIVALATFHAGERIKPSVIARDYIAIDSENFTYLDPFCPLSDFHRLKLAYPHSNDFLSFF